MSWTQGGVQPRSKWVKPTGVLAAGGVKRGRGRRKRSSDDHLSGGAALRNQCAAAHRVVAVRGAGAAGVERGVDLGGGRSSDNDGTGTTVHGRGRCWCLRASGDVLSTMGCSDASGARSSNGGFMNSGEELSAPTSSAARERGRARGAGGNTAGLTSGSKWSSADSGRRRRRRIGRRHPAAVVGEEGRKRHLGAVLTRVARRGGRVGGGGASESIGGARQWLWPRRRTNGGGGRSRVRARERTEEEMGTRE